MLCVIDVFTKYAWDKLLKDKNAKPVLNGFIGVVNESKHKPRIIMKIAYSSWDVCKNFEE